MYNYKSYRHKSRCHSFVIVTQLISRRMGWRGPRSQQVQPSCRNVQTVPITQCNRSTPDDCIESNETTNVVECNRSTSDGCIESNETTAWSTVIKRSTCDLPSTARWSYRPSLTYPSSCDRPSRTRSREPCSVVLIGRGHHYKNDEQTGLFQRSPDVTVKIHHQGSFNTSLEISEMTSPEMISSRC